ncbi:hypothetical protein MnBA_23240 [Marinobacterium sp. BA1]
MPANEFGNSVRYLEVLNQLDVIHETYTSETSRSAFGSKGSCTFALWCNNPYVQAGSFDTHSAADLNRFLNLCTDYDVNTVVLFIDSAGVSLKDPKNGMEGVAQSIKMIHHINVQPDRKTVSIIGDTRGCFGGALLIASACQYQIADANARIGVSGPQVIESITQVSRHAYADVYSAQYRLNNSEISHILTDQNLLRLVSELPPLQLNTSFLQALINSLPCGQESEVDPIGFDQQVIDLAALKETAASFLNTPKASACLKGNAEQPFAFENEAKGFSRYLKALAATMRYRVESGMQIEINVTTRGSGATFIAFSMMGSTLEIAPDATVTALPQAAIDRILANTPSGAKPL